MWNEVHDVVCDEKDIQHIRQLRKEYKNLNRNLWNPFDSKLEKIMGCTTVNRIYITSIGDVLACPYVHIKIGNVFKQTIKLHIQISACSEQINLESLLGVKIFAESFVYFPPATLL